MKTVKPLEAKIRKLVGKFKGKAGVALKNFKTRDALYINADDRCPTASTIKIPIMVEVYYQVKEKKIKLTDPMIYRHKNHVGGSGIIQYLSDGLKISVQDAMYMMIVLSDNTTTNMLIDLLGVKNINCRMESLGLYNIKVFRKAYGKKPEVEPELCKKFGFGMATPREMNQLLEMIYRGRVPDKPSCKQMIEIMKNQFYEAQLRRWVHGKNVWVANKTGSVNGVRNDVGIIHTPKSDWAISVFCKNVKDLRWELDNEGHLLIATISKLVFEHYTS